MFQTLRESKEKIIVGIILLLVGGVGGYIVKGIGSKIDEYNRSKIAEELKQDSVFLDLIIGKIREKYLSIYLTSSGFNSEIAKYVKSDDLNSRMQQYLSTTAFETRIGQYLQITDFETRIGQYIKVIDLDSRLGHFLVASDFERHNTSISNRLAGLENRKIKYCFDARYNGASCGENGSWTEFKGDGRTPDRIRIWFE